MIDSICDIIKQRLVTYPFVDKISGVVTETREITEGGKVNIFPKATDVACDDCEFGVEVRMIPDSKYKSVIYFEDNGTFPFEQGFEARLRLVFWLNMYKLGEASNANLILDAIVATVMTELQDIRGVNVEYLRKVTVRIAQVINATRMQEIFSRWTYREEVTQFLTWPYRAFAVDIRVSYEIARGCLEDIVLQTPIDCLNPELVNPN